MCIFFIIITKIEACFQTSPVDRPTNNKCLHKKKKKKKKNVIKPMRKILNAKEKIKPRTRLSSKKK